MIFHCEPVDFAPGLYFAAGQVQLENDWISATGVGRNRELARARCRAEIAEGIALRCVSTAVRNEIVQHPASGIAAASTVSEAVTRATGEAWERLAVHNWWLGRRTRTVDRSAQARIEQCFKKWKRSSDSNVRLLDLTMTPDYCCYLACTENLQQGTRVFGVSADRNRDAAITAAAREMIQMEMGLNIILHRQKHGRKLAPIEHRILQRAVGLFDVGSALFCTEKKLADLPLLPPADRNIRVSILQNRSPSVVAVALSAPADTPELSSTNAPWHQWSPYY